MKVQFFYNQVTQHLIDQFPQFFGSAGNGKTELQFPFGLAVDR